MLAKAFLRAATDEPPNVLEHRRMGRHSRWSHPDPLIPRGNVVEPEAFATRVLDRVSTIQAPYP
jgi:hypothetical protein